MKLSLLIAPIALLLVVACNGDGETPESSTTGDAGATTPAAATATAPSTLTIEFQGSEGTSELTVEIADTPSERYTGLRNRQSMPEDNGMIFVWPGQSTSAFGMPETYIPLTVAFIAENGTIVHFEDMEPLSTTSHRSPEPYFYAIEANQGWFERNGITTGDRATIPDGLRATAR